MVKITEQYLHYIAQMEAYQFDLAAEYLLMAAMLIEIKSRLLLPRPEEVEDEEADPRAELVRRLLAYEQMKRGGFRAWTHCRVPDVISLGRICRWKLRLKRSCRKCTLPI